MSHEDEYDEYIETDEPCKNCGGTAHYDDGPYEDEDGYDVCDGCGEETRFCDCAKEEWQQWLQKREADKSLSQDAASICEDWQTHLKEINARKE